MGTTHRRPLVQLLAAGLAAFLVLILVTSLWDIEDELQGQLSFLSLLAKAVYLLVQATLVPHFFKKNYRTFFLAAIPAPLLRLLTLRFILTQIALTLLVSVILIGPAVLLFSLQAKHAKTAITAFPQPR